MVCYNLRVTWICSGVGDEDEDRLKDESAALFNEAFAASTQGKVLNVTFPS